MSIRSSMKHMNQDGARASPWVSNKSLARQTPDLNNNYMHTSGTQGMDDDGKSRVSRGEWKKTDNDSVVGSTQGYESHFGRPGSQK